MALNAGAGPNGGVLKPETVKLMMQDGLAASGLPDGAWKTSIPSLSNNGEFFPGIDKGWSHSFMTNRERPRSCQLAESLMWTGQQFFLD